MSFGHTAPISLRMRAFFWIAVACNVLKSRSPKAFVAPGHTIVASGRRRSGNVLRREDALLRSTLSRGSRACFAGMHGQAVRKATSEDLTTEDEEDGDLIFLPESIQEQILEAIMKGVEADPKRRSSSERKKRRVFVIRTEDDEKVFEELKRPEKALKAEMADFKTKRGRRLKDTTSSIASKRKARFKEGGRVCDNDTPHGKHIQVEDVEEEIEEKEQEEEEGWQHESDALARISKFDWRPREVCEYLDQYVVRQDEAKKVLSVAICDHYNVVRRCLADDREREAEYSKPNILLLGASGSGKTYVVRTLAKLLGVPFIKADATKFTEAGIVGEDAEDLVRQLVDQADGDVRLAQYGIIYVDEVDKLCRSEASPSISGAAVAGSTSASSRGVQSTFLKVMEDTDVVLNKMWATGIPEITLGSVLASSSSRAPTRVSTKYILFIFSGAFTGLDTKLRMDREQRSLGFIEQPKARTTSPGVSGDEDASAYPKSYLSQATTADFVSVGLEPEFIGRIPVRVAVDPLDASALEQILRDSEGSALRQYKRDFGGYGIDLAVTDEFCRAVAEKAAAENTGARGLVTVLERTFRDFKYRLPCSGIDRLVCDAHTVAHPQAQLEELLTCNVDKQDAVRREDATRFENHLCDIFGLNHGRLKFDESALEWLIHRSRGADVSLRTLCQNQFGLFPGATDNGMCLKALEAFIRRSQTKDLPTLIPVDFFTQRSLVLRAWLSHNDDSQDEALDITQYGQRQLHSSLQPSARSATESDIHEGHRSSMAALMSPTDGSSTCTGSALGESRLAPR